MKLKHIDLDAGCVIQDAREVRTKFSKTFTTFFFPVGDDIRQIVSEWVTFLRTGDALGGRRAAFPRDPNSGRAIPAGLRRLGLATSPLEKRCTRIRAIFRDAFVRYCRPALL